MKNTTLFTLLLILGSGLPAVSQSFSLISGREPVTSLDGLWRFHTGDDPSWAEPGFDDSSWPLIRSDESWDRQGYPDYGDYAWYRFTVEIPDGSKPTALLVSGIDTGYQVFADGKLIGSKGSTAPGRNVVSAYLPEIYRLPPGSPGQQFIHVAIRAWHDAAFAFQGGMLQPGSFAGAPDVLARELTRDQDARTVSDVATYGFCLLASCVGLITLVLFFSRTEDREYLWFSILLLVIGAQAVLNIAWAYVSIPRLWSFLLVSVADGTSTIAALSFFSIVLRTPRSLLWRVAYIGATAYPLGLVLYGLGWMNWGEAHALAVAFMLPADVWFVGTLVLSSRKKRLSERWLLAPAVLYYGYRFISHLSWATLQLGWLKKSVPLDFALTSQPFPVDLSDILNYIFVLSLMIFLVRRFSAARQEEARLSQEMEAARSIQSLLIPAVSQSSPNFAVEHAYLPATEVGGDFFQVLPGTDGSLLIVVGDVSGKGLQAAMTVSAIVGALRDSHERQPSEVLAHLNRVLFGQIGGFVTCCAILIADDGLLTAASAGHLPPYRNGEEMPVPDGLPLGILAESSYVEIELELGRADRLTFVSDGVVEARNAKGELLGFDRMAELTTKRAAEIAEAALHWGQEDDITVLTVARASKLETSIR